MLTLLKILGLITLVVIVILVLGIRWLLGKFKAMVADAVPTPSRINPEPEALPRWRHPKQVGQYAEEFRALGFQDVGSFSIPEMGGLQFLAFLHPAERFYGCVYDHHKLQPTFDVVCVFPDDTGLSGTNTKMGEALEQRPGQVTLRIDGASVSDVFTAMRNHPSAARERRSVSAAEFVPYFRKAHADYMNWRLKLGGTSRDEIRRQASQDGQPVTDEQVEEAYQSLRETYVEQLKEGCIAQFLDDSKLSAAEWERRQGSVFAIPETLELKEVIESIADAVALDDEQRHQLDQVQATFGQTGIDLVQQVVQQNVASLGLEKVGEVQQPVHAWILRAPSQGSVGLGGKVAA